jgi:hypothetical protein
VWAILISGRRLGYDIESFNNEFRAVSPKGNWFLPLAVACSRTDPWRDVYNRFRPYSSLEDLAPAEFVERRIASGLRLFPSNTALTSAAQNSHKVWIKVGGGLLLSLP